MSNDRQSKNRHKREIFTVTPDIKFILDYIHDCEDDFPCPEYLLHAENQQAFAALAVAVILDGDYSPESFERAAKKAGVSVAFIQGGLKQIVALGYHNFLRLALSQDGPILKTGK